jgi:hypothetical protein
MKLPSKELRAFVTWVPWHFGTPVRAVLEELGTLRQKLEAIHGEPLCGRFSFELVIMRWATRYAWARELREWPRGSSLQRHVSRRLVSQSGRARREGKSRGKPSDMRETNS